MNRQKPFIVEFTGTPEAGKTTTIDLVEQKLLNLGYTVKVYPESAEKSKNIFPKSEYAKLDSKLWMNLDTLKNLIEAPYQNYDIVLFDRGSIDRKFWIELDSSIGILDNRFTNLTLFDTMLPDLLIVLRVSVDESLRRRGGEGHVVTKSFLETYNSILDVFINSIGINKDIVCTDNMQIDEVVEVVTKTILENLNKPS